MNPRRAKIDDALDEVRRQIEAVVREEQIRDQLTGLANGLALSEALQSAIERNHQFWCALVEVDYFKRLNDRFSYAVADGLLLKIAKRLEGFDDYMVATLPVRAHGDEFYLFGQLGDTELESRVGPSLDRLREEIAGMRVPTQTGDMNCTVSIGWMTSSDAGETVLTERATLRMVEAATASAKMAGRNRVVRYSTAVEKAQRNSLRDDCLACGASFTVDVPLDTPHQGDLRCPNCGATRPRPAQTT